MKLLDAFRTSEPVLDCWSFVTDEIDPSTGYYDMLATSENGQVFSQWTSGQYEPGVANEHLGERPRYMSEVLLNHVLERLQ